MKKNQLILAIFSAAVALILLIAVILIPKEPLSENTWTPQPDRPRASLTPSPIAPVRAPTSRVIVPERIPTQTVLVEITPVAESTEQATDQTQSPDETQVFFVAPDGNKDGDGSKDEPWELQYALNHPDNVKPGAIIWVRGGEYQGSYTSRLEGEEGKPITVRAYPGERAIWMNDDRVLDISTSQYVIFWGIEITATENSRDPVTRPETAYGVRINQGKNSNHIKFVNMIVHDMPAQGFAWWMANSDSEIYGSLIFYNGVNQFDHGIYVMNENGTKKIIDNFIFDNASHGIHAYGKETQWLNNLYIEGNTLFNNGSIGYTTTKGAYGIYKRNILVGGLNVAENPVILNNLTYFPNQDGEALNLGYRAGTTNAVVENNYFAGGRVQMAGRNSGVTMQKNTIMGFGAQALGLLPNTKNEWLLFKPTDIKIFIRPNQYEPNRANVTIYNWSQQDQVVISSVDLNGIQIEKGNSYELRNVQDYFNDVIEGTYDGEAITIPMTGRSVAQPLGLNFKPASTFPEFGAFVLIIHQER